MNAITLSLTGIERHSLAIWIRWSGLLIVFVSLLTLWFYAASPVNAQTPPNCASASDVHMYNSSDLRGETRDPPLIVRDHHHQDGFRANLMLSCIPDSLAWEVLDAEGRPVERLDTPDPGDYVRGTTTKIVDEREWDPDGSVGPMAPQPVVHYEIYFANGHKVYDFDDDPSLEAESRYALVVSALVGNEAKTFRIMMGTSEGDGMLDAIRRGLRYESFARPAIGAVLGGGQKMGCSAAGEAGGVPPDNCDDADQLTSVGVKPQVAYVVVESNPSGHKTHCYGFDETIRINVRFDQELMPVSWTQPNPGEFHLHPDNWPDADLALELLFENGGVTTPVEANYAGGFLTHQKSFVFTYRVQDDDVAPNGLRINRLIHKGTGQATGMVHPVRENDRGVWLGHTPDPIVAWFLGVDETTGLPTTGRPAGATVDFPVIPIDNRDCVDGTVEGQLLIEELEMTTFSGLMVGTPAHLTYEREITARGWRVSMNLVYAVLIPLIVGWMGMTIIVKPMVGGEGEWSELIPRMFLGLIAAASSYWWLRLIIDLASGMSRYVAEALSVSPGDMVAIASSSLGLVALTATIGLLKVFLALYLIFLLFGILIIMQFVIRIVMINLLIMLAPIAMALWILPHTANWGRKWLNMFMVSLFQHTIQLMSLALALSFVKALMPGSGQISATGAGNPDDFFWSLLLGIAGMYLTFRLPSMLGAGDVYEGLMRYVYQATAIASQGPAAMANVTRGVTGAVGGGALGLVGGGAAAASSIGTQGLGGAMRSGGMNLLSNMPPMQAWRALRGAGGGGGTP